MSSSIGFAHLITVNASVAGPGIADGSNIEDVAKSCRETSHVDGRGCRIARDVDSICLHRRYIDPCVRHFVNHVGSVDVQGRIPRDPDSSDF